MEKPKQRKTKVLDLAEIETKKLRSAWVLWYHDSSDDWNLSSYQKIYEFDTVAGFWRMFNNLPSIVNSMFFLMKKGHSPIWDVPENIKGGSWLFKFPKKMADCYWLKMSCYMVGETITNDTTHIIGLSLSPKIYNVTIRVWNCNDVACREKVEFNPEYSELIRGKPLYKVFVDPNITHTLHPTDEEDEKQVKKKHINKSSNQAIKQSSN